MSKLGKYCLAKVSFYHADKKISASINHLNPPQISFIIRDPLINFDKNTLLKELNISLNDRILYQGNAIITEQFFNGLFTLVTVILTDAWQAQSLALTEPAIEDELQNFLADSEQLFKGISTEYRITINQIKTFLHMLHAWTNRLEENYCMDDQTHTLNESKQHTIFNAINASVQIKLIQLFQSLEKVGVQINDAAASQHANFARQELHPLLLCAPFVHHAYTKPFGYPADFETLNMLMSNVVMGKTLFAKIIHSYHIDQSIGLAYRNRTQWFVNKLNAIINEPSTTSSAKRILSIGCGPAFEIQALMKKNPAISNCELHLVDHDPTTLDYARAQLAKLIGETGQLPNITFNCQSVIQLLKQAEGNHPETEYDVIICPNLFDYLSDKVCSALIQLFYAWLKPSGQLLIANTHPSNPCRYQMQHLLDWDIAYRSQDTLKQLAHELGEVHIHQDNTGVMLFLEIKKNLKLEKISINYSKPSKSALNLVQ